MAASLATGGLLPRRARDVTRKTVPRITAGRSRKGASAAGGQLGRTNLGRRRSSGSRSRYDPTPPERLVLESVYRHLDVSRSAIVNGGDMDTGLRRQDYLRDGEADPAACRQHVQAARTADGQGCFRQAGSAHGAGQHEGTPGARLQVAPDYFCHPQPKREPRADYRRLTSERFARSRRTTLHANIRKPAGSRGRIRGVRRRSISGA